MNNKNFSKEKKVKFKIKKKFKVHVLQRFKQQKKNNKYPDMKCHSDITLHLR